MCVLQSMGENRMISPLRSTLHRDFPADNPTGMTMRIGILFPVVIFIVAVIFLIWFFVGGYAAPGA